MNSYIVEYRIEVMAESPKDAFEAALPLIRGAQREDTFRIEGPCLQHLDGECSKIWIANGDGEGFVLHNGDPHANL